MIFLDTSALVKHYHPELGSAAIEAVIAENGAGVAISSLGLLEVRSALSTKARTGSITRDEAATLMLRVMADIAAGTIKVLKLTNEHFTEAERLLT